MMQEMSELQLQQIWSRRAVPPDFHPLQLIRDERIYS